MPRQPCHSTLASSSSSAFCCCWRSRCCSSSAFMRSKSDRRTISSFTSILFTAASMSVILYADSGSPFPLASPRNIPCQSRPAVGSPMERYSPTWSRTMTLSLPPLTLIPRPTCCRNRASDRVGRASCMNSTSGQSNPSENILTLTSTDRPPPTAPEGASIVPLPGGAVVPPSGGEGGALYSSMIRFLSSAGVLLSITAHPTPRSR